MKLSHFRHRLDVLGIDAAQLRSHVQSHAVARKALMKANGINALIARFDAVEYGICRQLNRGAALPFPCRVFQIASRLGDGIIWYVLIFTLPLLYGSAAVKPAVVMALTGILGVVLYKLLKRVFVRERPFITHSSIALAGAPLDRYSFPSGHTLHAVSFAWQASAHFPELSWVLVPLAALIAGSRVVLGLHYPTDVLVGAVIGGSLAELGLSLA
jgi:undecaprenyl-diphosphatase